MKALEHALDELSRELDHEPHLEHAASGRADEAVPALRDHLYSKYFCRWDAQSASHGRYSARTSGEPAFVAALAAAGRGALCWEPGWTVVKAEAGWAFVSNGRVNLFVDDRAQLAPREARVGAPVSVRMPCARENVSPGYFHLVGRSGPVRRAEAHYELFLNLCPAAAAPWVSALLRGPRLERLRFEAKVANSPGAYCRVDTAHLYVEPASYPGLLAFARSWRHAHPGWWRKGTPLFTRELAPGLAVGEAPRGRGAESFGQERCRLAAEEVAAALEVGDRAASSWCVRVEARFSRERLPLEGTVRSPGPRRKETEGPR